MKKLLGMLFVGTTGIVCLNAQSTNEKINLLPQEEPVFTKKKPVYGGDKDIWKFNALGTLFNGFNISYERKFAPKWSLNINSVTNVQTPAVSVQNVFGGNWATQPYYWRTANINQSLALQMRYYHNLERRQRKGKKTGFSGNYFAVELGGAFTLDNSPDGYYKWLSSGNRYSASLLYGIQREIGRNAYIDFNIGVSVGHYNVKGQGTNYSENFITPVAKLGIGFKF